MHLGLNGISRLLRPILIPVISRRSWLCPSQVSHGRGGIGDVLERPSRSNLANVPTVAPASDRG